MKINRIFASIAASAVLVSSASFASVFAASDTVTISAATKSVTPGESFTFDISLADIPTTGLNTVEFGVNFDSTLMTISDVALGKIADTGAASEENKGLSGLGDTVFNWNVSGNQLCLMWSTGLSDSYWIKSAGTFVTVTAKAKTTEGVSKLEIAPISRVSYPGETSKNTDIIVGYNSSDTVITNYKNAVTNGAITIAPEENNKYGDVNCDGSITISDLVLMARYVAEDSEMQPLSAQGLKNADCVADGKVNSSDITALARYLAHLIQESELGK